MKRLIWGLLPICLLLACDEGGDAESEKDGGLSLCADGLDNDEDGRIDLEDPGCSTPEDGDEGGEPACVDRLENDGDGRIDFPQDPGCETPEDEDEKEAIPAQCQNQLDDDEDGRIDFPQDRGCSSPGDEDESDEASPQCSDGLDNDEDGYTDFPGDPGCGSHLDDDEADERPTVRAQCKNGMDDDGDGLIDRADPSCLNGDDAYECDAFEAVPACFNGLDDDGDGVIDYPLVSGLGAAGDDDEGSKGLPDCSNGLDDDGDGLTDYPEDPGCDSVGDVQESDPELKPHCADGHDNDRDGQVDYPDDPGCSSAADMKEEGECAELHRAVEVEAGRIYHGNSQTAVYGSSGSCGGAGGPEVVFLYRVDEIIEALWITTTLPENRLETTLYTRRACAHPETEELCVLEPLDEQASNTLFLENPRLGEHYIFMDAAGGQGGEYAFLLEEIPLAPCRNGLDDDEDGRVDYPMDPGCENLRDRDEQDPEHPPLCADGLDNDGDGLIDFPEDSGCEAAVDEDELDLCGQGLRILEYPIEQPFLLGNSSDGSRGQFRSPNCGGNNAPEEIYHIALPFDAQLRLSVDHPETVHDTLLYLRRDCLSAASELACDQGLEGRGSLFLERLAAGDYFLFVDHPLGLGGPFKLSLEMERLPPACGDQIDNDEDGFIDGDDPGCMAPDDEDERDPEEPGACWDLQDNDGDGLMDYPADPGCFSKGDPDEEDPAQPPACANGLDDDEDDLSDYPLDPGCASAGDDEEEMGRLRPQCSNRIDDDRDGQLDFPYDPGCAAPGDLSEQNDSDLPACSDGEDNDRDGLVDFPYEPGCPYAGYRLEDNPLIPAACSDGADDDGDGFSDFPRDPGCISAGDDDEQDPDFAPQCANGLDDDGNGRIDWPDDPGCRFASDSREYSEGHPPRRCADGLDNDDDGIVDLADPGCENSRDDDESDREQAPGCNDGLDNDGDGLLDWPQDEGCAARGDLCEEPGHGLCGALCLDIRNDPENCGRCARSCDPGVECIESFCGGFEISCALTEEVLPLEGSGRLVVDTSLQPDLYQGSCGGRSSEQIVAILIEEPALVTCRVQGQTHRDTLIWARLACDDEQSELACNDDFNGLNSQIEFNIEERGTVYLFVDGFGNNSGSVEVEITVQPF